jgi:hypothetical protein
MEGICPKCKVRLELPASGIYQCERCRTRFEVAIGVPRPGPVVPPAPTAYPPFGAPAPGMAPGYGMPAVAAPPMMAPAIDPALQAPCATHPNNPAARVCERCGDFMCGLCTTFIEGRAYCPKCFDMLYRRGSLQFAQRQFALPGLALTLGILSLLANMTCFFMWAGVPMAIGGLWAGLSAMKEHAQRPDLPNRGLSIAGIATSAIGILVAAAWIVVVFVIPKR